MLSYDGTIDTGSLTLRDCCTDETNNLAIIVESGTNTLRMFNLSSLSQVGSNYSVTAAPYAVIMINSASALVAGSSTTLDLVQVPSGYKTSHTGGLALATSTRTQRIAADKNNSTALIVTNTAGTLVKMVGSTASVSQINIDMPSNDLIQSIIFIGAGRFIISTTSAHFYEIDSTGKIYKQAGLEREFTSTRGTNLSSPQRISIGMMAYNEGFLLCSVISTTSSPFMACLDWTTGTTLESYPYTDVSLGTLFSNVASGHVIAARSADTANASIHQPIVDCNFINYGFSVDNTVFTGSAGSIVSLGINTTNGKAWALQEVIDDIRVFTLTASSATTSRTFSSPGNVDFRLMLFDLTAGQGNGKRFIDTYTTSPRSLTVPTGRTFLEVIKIGTGSDATWDVSTYTT